MPAAPAWVHQDLARLVRSIELLDTRTQRTEAPLTPPPDARTIWFGLGLSGDEATKALPIDVLALVFVQERLRRTFGFANSEVLLADTNALRSGIAALQVHRARARAQHVLSEIARRLDLPLRVLRASELPIEPVDLGEPPPDGAYLFEQLHQMEQMRRRGASVKLGWALSSSRLDERYFDEAFAARRRETPLFIYTVGGRTLDPRRPRACPYLCRDRSARILLEPGEQVREKLDAADPRAARGYRRLLGKIARAQAWLLGGRAPRDPLEAIEELIDGLGPWPERDSA